MRHGQKGREKDPSEKVGKKGKIETGCLLLRQEVIVPMCNHKFGEVPHECLHLYMQVSENLVSASSADQLDDVVVNASTEERHGPCGA